MTDPAPAPEDTEEAPTPAPEIPTPQSAWEKIWAPLLVQENGDLDFDGIQRLLFDYAGMLHDLAILYAYLTEGKITHPQTAIHEVMVESDLHLSQTIDSAIQHILNEILETLEPINTERAEVQLEALIRVINELYERGEE